MIFRVLYICSNSQAHYPPTQPLHQRDIQKKKLKHKFHEKYNKLTKYGHFTIFHFLAEK